MGLPEYVFCMWKNRLWPAKVLSQDKCLSKKCRLSVEIFTVKEQIDISLSDTKPFLMGELQKIKAVLDRTKRLIATTEERVYQRAVKQAENIINQPSLSASQSTGSPSTQETTVDKIECKSSGTTVRENKSKGRKSGKCEESKKTKPNSSEAAVSKDALKIPTTCETEASPAKLRTAQNAQRNKKRSLGKRDDCSLTISQKKGRPEKTKQRPVQRSVRLPSKRLQKINKDLQAESSDSDNGKGNGHREYKYLKHRMPDFEEETGLSSSELSMEIDPPECPAVCAMSSSQDDTEEDIQLPVVVLQEEPAAIVRGSFVWCKFQHYPYWPSLVRLVGSKQKKASIIFLDESISNPTNKINSFKVALRSIKPYDCPEKQKFLESARKDYGKSIDWCDSLISDYRIRLGCGSFSGSFLEYCSAAISLPVRRELERGKREGLFPVIGSEVTEAKQEAFNVKSEKNKKLLPDRGQAARDRANEKLVEFIVNNKEAEKHLLDILAGKKKSKWLKMFQSSNRRMNCLDTYIEDEGQIEHVVGYLQTVCEKMSSATKKLMYGDPTQFIFEVLIPEAVIFAIAATEQISYDKAQEKYLKGPAVTRRERRMFEEQILEKKRAKLSEEDTNKKSSRTK